MFEYVWIYVEQILYVPSLKKNVISVTVLEDKGLSVSFSEGKVLIWSKGKPFINNGR